MSSDPLSHEPRMVNAIPFDPMPTNEKLIELIAARTKAGQDRKDIQTRLAHTSGKTTDI
jgi:hypothetical protein